MFKKKECKNCGEKFGEKYSFCPACGRQFSGKQREHRDFGMLGESDQEEFQNVYNSMFGGIGGNMINKMFESAVKMLEKEMQKEMKRNVQNPMEPKTNFQLFINGKKIDVNGKQQKQEIEKKEISLPNKVLKKFSELPRKEPKTNVRRFSDKVVYEINMPGIETDEDISIVKLENSIEIKAVSKNKAYLKILPINLPVMNYAISNGKLVLELDGKE